MINLEQIKADIAARKGMPAWSANTSIERIKTINATLPSFSLKTVEMLVEALEKAQTGEKRWREVVDAFCADDADWHKLTDSTNELISLLSQSLCKQADRIAELESRTVTLSANDIFNVPEGKNYVGGEMVYVDTIRDYLEECGIRVEAGTFRENENSSTVYFREISETSTKGGNQ